MVSRFFPKAHKRAGEETGFVEKILKGVKVHTIRANLKRWEYIAEEVNSARAYVSLRYWENKPYRSKQIEYGRLHYLTVMKLERNEQGAPVINGVKTSWAAVAFYDGLTFEDFQDWFKDYPNKPMAVIYFSGIEKV